MLNIVYSARKAQTAEKFVWSFGMSGETGALKMSTYALSVSNVAGVLSKNKNIRRYLNEKSYFLWHICHSK